MTKNSNKMDEIYKEMYKSKLIQNINRHYNGK